MKKKQYTIMELTVVTMTVNHQMLAGSLILTDTSGLDGLGDGGDVIGDDIISGDADVREFFSDDDDFEF